MELTNDFRVDVGVPEAWKLLTDVERIAPLLPGAQLEEIEGDEYRGVVKVKVGPITAQYRGVARFIERDEVAHRAVMRAEGRRNRALARYRPADHRQGRPVRARCSRGRERPPAARVRRPSGGRRAF